MYSKDGYDSKIFRKWGLILGTNQSLQAGMNSVIGGVAWWPSGYSAGLQHT